MLADLEKTKYIIFSAKLQFCIPKIVIIKYFYNNNK